MQHRPCACRQVLEAVSEDFLAGAEFGQCFDRLAQVLKCSTFDQCGSSVEISDRAASLITMMAKRG
jgi:hypothetical protein